MKKILLFLTITVLAITLFAFSSFGTTQDFATSKFDQSSGVAATYLDLGVGAAASGMGNAYLGASKDASSIFWNPAGLAQMMSDDKNWSMFFSHNVWVMETMMDHISIAKMFPKVGVFALGIEYFNAGTMDKYTIDQFNNFTQDGTFTPYALVVDFAYSNKLDGDLDYGINGKYILDNIDESYAQSFAFDLGLRYHSPIKGLDFSMVAKNFAGVLSGNVLPKQISFAAAYLLSLESFSLLSDIDVCGVVNNYPVYKFGLEGHFMDLFTIRAGYHTDNTLITEGFKDFTFGAGININDKFVDFSYEPYGELGTSLKFSVGGDF